MKLAINLAWCNRNLEQEYNKWLSICSSNNIKLVRIFLCSWGINALFDDKDIKLLENVIKNAYAKRMDVCLVINNFVDYNINNYSDINNKMYSWKKNPYFKKYKNTKNFFKTIDVDYLSKIEHILNRMSKYKNIRYIEIMNEIDQIECPNKILINWVNSLIKKLKIMFKDRYIYTCSVSNYELFNMFSKKINCYVDLHFYSFPYESAMENIEYIIKRHSILYLGEYAKYSDSAYLNDINSKIYFASGLWAAYFYNLKYSPLHWWWQHLLNNKDYINIVNVYNILINKLGKVKKVENVNIKFKFISRNDNKLEKKKIKERLDTLIKHPLFIFNEFRNIKKFIKKKFSEKSKIICRKILLYEKDVYYLECSNDIIIEDNINKDKMIDLLSGIEKNYTKNISRGVYIIF